MPGEILQHGSGRNSRGCCEDHSGAGGQNAWSGTGEAPSNHNLAERAVSTDLSDVIVVGGGIMGASTTYFLRKRGLSVTLLERDQVGQKTSGSSFGNLRRQGRPISQLPLANRASAIWANLPEVLGEEIEVSFSGHIRVGYDDRPELVEDFRNYAQQAAKTGLNLEVLAGKELKERFPFLGPEVLVGSYSPPFQEG